MTMILAADLPIDPQTIVGLLVLVLGGLGALLSKRHEEREKRRREEMRQGRQLPPETPPPTPADTRSSLPPLTGDGTRGASRPPLEPVRPPVAPAPPRPQPAPRPPVRQPPPTPSGGRVPQPLPRGQRRERADRPEVITVEELRRRARTRWGEPEPVRVPPAEAVTTAPKPAASQPVRPAATTKPAEPISAELSEVLEDRARLQQAIILAEVLGPPVSLRET
jgi:hypothetical protein